MLPHGNKLVNRVFTNKPFTTNELPTIKVDRTTILDAEKIAIGAFSPLEGFMCREDYLSVIYQERLANDVAWTIPIILAPSGKENLKIVRELREGDDIALEYNGESYAIMYLEEKFRYNKKELAIQVYSTTDSDHPNVNDIYNLGEVMLGGKIDLIKRVSQESTPLETRETFKKRYWKTIAGYQTRNPPHMVHEYLQRNVMEKVDGLLIHPVIGKLKSDDFPPEAIIESYRFLIDNYYPKNRVYLDTLSIGMRYAGPKAAIFLAIIRKNYGCTHFVIGRDMAGIKGLYEPYRAHEMFDEMDLGIEPIKFKEAFYCKRCDLIVTTRTCGHDNDNHVSMSMTKLREIIRKGVMPSEKMMRPEIARILMKYNR
ncbi:sulfate adenylyltransferase [Candidatus Bathyarchaeota archaeon]|nr:MAG: sulfate adenylyltransferase [Candidatus Bathyarchaeota archaeon]